jgi:6,7-dimethyl-8-ribityllumazine synthase
MKTAHSTVDIPKITEARIAILQSKWYREHTDKLVKKCVETLTPSECSEPDIHLLPGALELPLAARRLARQRGYEAIICFGAIMKGDTYHFEMIVDECIRGLGQVMLEEDIPILVEVLPVTSIEQLVTRCADDEFNKGIEAALATAEIIHWRRHN